MCVRACKWAGRAGQGRQPGNRGRKRNPLFRGFQFRLGLGLLAAATWKDAASHQASQQKQPTRPRQLRNVGQCSRPEYTPIPAPPPPKGVASTQNLQDFDRWRWPLLLASTSPRPRPCQRIAEDRSCPPAIRERRETRHESGLGIPTGLSLRMMRPAHNARPPCRRP